MSKKIIKGFTLVELIVVITILAILGTIAFISLQGYSKDSRNSVRISDTKLIKKALSIYITSNSKYPDPDNLNNVTYSGSTLWKQGTFGNNAFVNLKTLSNIPVDPSFGVEYDYSVLNSGNRFEIGSIMEGGLLSQNNSLGINKASALSNNEVVSYVSGDYTYKDIFVQTGSNCYNVSAPSIFIYNPVSYDLTYQGNYNFIYNGGVNIPNSYSGVINLSAPGKNFAIDEVYNKCSVDSLSDLDDYVDNLLINYQQLDGESEFEDIIYNSNNNIFKLNSLNKLKDDGLTISDNVISELNAIQPYHQFTDSFTGSFNTSIWNGDNSYYSNVSDTLNKTDNSLDRIIFPDVPLMSISDVNISFDIIKITGDIIVYSNYVDPNNYYELKLNATGYQIIQKISSTEVTLTSINDPINNLDNINFIIKDNVIKFSVNGLEKERVVATKIESLGNTLISIANSGDKIDNFNLLYR